MVSIETLVNETLGPSNIEFNESKSFAFAYQKEENISRVTKYMIVRIKDLKIMEQNTCRLGSVKWINDSEIELYCAPGILKIDDDPNQFKRIISISSYTNEF